MRQIRIFTLLAALAVPTAGYAAQPQPPKEFVPIDTIPADEQIPAINLVADLSGWPCWAMYGRWGGA